MQRRSFIKYLILGGLLPSTSASSMTRAVPHTNLDLEKPAPEVKPASKVNIGPSDDYRNKMRQPDSFHHDDLTISQNEQALINQLAIRLGKVKNFVGYSNFSVLSFDKMLRYGRNYSQIGRFSKTETDFLEKLFYEDAMHYGFYGDKPLTNLTQSIQKRTIIKVPHTGQYLFKGKPLELFTKIKQDIGDNLILTSGVRSVVKQMHLFLRKASNHNGNLSLASRSLAPPGYSFHGIGDFDVGHKNLGAQNFTNAFAQTDEFKKLIDLGYINIRYLMDNDLGVRFEPWHIKSS